MDELLQKAIERREALRRELAAIENLIQALSEIEPPAPRPEQRELFTPRAKRPRRAAAIAAMMDEAERLILEAGKPLTRGELLRQLEASGHAIEGSDKNKVLGTNLWRSRRFHNLQGVGYWPKSTPIPEQLKRVPIRDSMLS